VLRERRLEAKREEEGEGEEEGRAARREQEEGRRMRGTMMGGLSG
jgi:hypothetical protein